MPVKAFEKTWNFYQNIVSWTHFTFIATRFALRKFNSAEYKITAQSFLLQAISALQHAILDAVSYFLGRYIYLSKTNQLKQTDA